MPVIPPVAIPGLQQPSTIPGIPLAGQPQQTPQGMPMQTPPMQTPMGSERLPQAPDMPPRTSRDITLESQTLFVDMALALLRNSMALRNQDVEVTFRGFDTQGLGELTQMHIENGLKQYGVELSQYHAFVLFEQMKAQGAPVVVFGSNIPGPKNTVSKADFTGMMERSNRNFDVYAYMVFRRVFDRQAAELKQNNGGKDADSSDVIEALWAGKFDQQRRGSATRFDFDGVLVNHDMTLCEAQKLRCWEIALHCGVTFLAADGVFLKGIAPTYQG